MLNTIFGTKITSTQTWTPAGARVPVTRVHVTPMRVTQVKTQDTDGYQAIQVGFGTQKLNRITQPLTGHLKKSGATDTAPRFLAEIRLIEPADVKVGDLIEPANILKEGDTVKVSGTSRGKGFAGGVKRWGFHGGPRTHGQSDRERAPGSIGQGTTPGRIFKGKKMAGRMGGKQITVRNLKVFKLDPDHQEIWIAGLIPGSSSTPVTITKTA